jgi:hypothetical protein
MIFTPDQCRTLASSGTKTDIEFHGCKFEDEGAAFVEASAARRDETSDPAKLRFGSDNPFNGRNMALFVNQHRLDSLVISRIGLNSEVTAVAAGVRCLTLEDCDLLDEGAALLIELVRQGRGPKELRIPSGNPFGSSGSFVIFMNALRGNEHLERLQLPRIDDRQEMRALAAALHENKGLVHLAVDFVLLDDSDRAKLLDAISIHHSLHSLDLKMWPSLDFDFTLQMHFDAKKRREFTKAVADMLSVNKRVEVMSFYDSTHDPFHTLEKEDWDVFVVPRLECNKYRKLFPSIQTIGDESTRAAVLARALAKFATKPHLVWMLLSQNHDIVSSYL